MYVTGYDINLLSFYQVYFLEGHEDDWSFVEYRTGSMVNSTRLDQVFTPLSMSFTEFLSIILYNYESFTAPFAMENHIDVIDDPLSQPFEGDFYMMDTENRQVVYRSSETSTLTTENIIEQ
jgi:hypothetical protein